jgi:hypothetical protein
MLQCLAYLFSCNRGISLSKYGMNPPGLRKHCTKGEGKADREDPSLDLKVYENNALAPAAMPTLI